MASQNSGNNDGAAQALKPEPKVAVAGASGALSVVIVWLVSLSGAAVPAEVATAIGVLVTTIAAWVMPRTDRPGST